MRNHLQIKNPRKFPTSSSTWKHGLRFDASMHKYFKQVVDDDAQDPWVNCRNSCHHRPLLLLTYMLTSDIRKGGHAQQNHQFNFSIEKYDSNLNMAFGILPKSCELHCKLFQLEAFELINGEYGSIPAWTITNLTSVSQHPPPHLTLLSQMIWDQVLQMVKVTTIYTGWFHGYLYTCIVDSRHMHNFSTSYMKYMHAPVYQYT